MEFVKCGKDTLLNPLQTVSGIVERRHTLPVLANVLIKKEQQKLTLTSTDIEIQIRTSVELDDDAQSVQTTVNAKKLLDILKALPDGKDVSLKLNDSKLAIASGKSKFNLQTLPANDFPEMTLSGQFGQKISIAQKQHFKSFNDFFIRQLKPEARPIVSDSLAVASPADGKILAYENVNNSDFYIKGFRFNVNSFVNNSALAKKYETGSMIVFRLAPPDYHRYHFPVSGVTASSNIKIDGDYYSVNPLALRKKAEIFWLNKREYVVIKSPVFGDVVMVEVGATMVGSMIQTYTGTMVKKGQEKGYFKFGGSTVVLLFEKDKITIDEDLLNNTSKGLETTIKMGEQIAVKK